jgi:hypothetical protein
MINCSACYLLGAGRNCLDSSPSDSTNRSKNDSQNSAATFNIVLALLLRGGIAQGVPYTATMSDLLRFPIWVLIIPESSTRALWQ